MGCKLRQLYVWEMHGRHLERSIGDPFTNSFTTTMFFLEASLCGPCDFNIDNNFVANFI